jgi:putative ABC transport system permease protein
MEIGPILRSMRRNKPRFLLIGAEVALTLAIVVNCVALILDARAEMTRESGFDDEHLVWVRTSNFGQEYEDEAYVRDLLDRDLGALRAMPGVRAASATYFRPWQGGGSSTEVLVEGRPGMRKVRAQYYLADPGIFETLGVTVEAGRGLTDDDFAIPSDAEVFPTVITRGLADLLFPGGGGLGQVLVQDGDDSERYPVVGIIDRFYNPYGWPIHEYALFFAAPVAGAGGTGFLVRTDPGRTEAVAGALERRLVAVADGRNVDLGTIDELRAILQAGDRTLVTVLNLLMVLLIFVTALGIVGLTSFSVAERRRVIGTRRALGATRGAVLRYFLVENWLVVTAGAVVGVGLAAGLNYLLLQVVEGVRLAPGLLVAGVVLLWTLGLAAALGPALRGARVEPAVATRNV